MGRKLIDADKLLEELKEYQALQKGVTAEIIGVLIEAVEEQPTAYDPEKLVEQLEGLKMDLVHPSWNEAIEAAIGIVKEGGFEGMKCEGMVERLNSFLYTQGKFGNEVREVLDSENEYLYSKGRYPTTIKKEDLTEDFIRIQSRSLWYMYGYLKASGIQDIRYKATKINHLFKDDYIYISYNGEIKVESGQHGQKFTNYDIRICGNSIIPIILAAEKYSGIDISSLREQIEEKRKWYKENYEEDYIREFGTKDVDLFEIYR